MGVSWTSSSGCFCDQDNCSSPVPQRMPACESEFILEEVGWGWLAPNFFSFLVFLNNTLDKLMSFHLTVLCNSWQQIWHLNFDSFSALAYKAGSSDSPGMGSAALFIHLISFVFNPWRTLQDIWLALLAPQATRALHSWVRLWGKCKSEGGWVTAPFCNSEGTERNGPSLCSSSRHLLAAGGRGGILY